MLGYICGISIGYSTDFERCFGSESVVGVGHSKFRSLPPVGRLTVWLPSLEMGESLFGVLSLP
jgi:hypothetical protein